jgi:hypothetical protein
VLGVKAATAEYGSGMIRLTLTATPQRWRLLAAKAVIFVPPSLGGLLPAWVQDHILEYLPAPPPTRSRSVICRGRPTACLPAPARSSSSPGWRSSSPRRGPRSSAATHKSRNRHRVVSPSQGLTVCRLCAAGGGGRRSGTL